LPTTRAPDEVVVEAVVSSMKTLELKVVTAALEVAPGVITICIRAFSISRK
jgi:hypothetical protein